MQFFVFSFFEPAHNIAVVFSFVLRSLRVLIFCTSTTISISPPLLLVLFLFYFNMDENFPWTEASFSVDGGDAQAGLSPQSLAVPVNKRAASCRVDHTYHDFSRVSEAVERKKASNFPAKLHLILSDPECSHVSRDCSFANDDSHCFYHLRWLWLAMSSSTKYILHTISKDHLMDGKIDFLIVSNDLCDCHDYFRPSHQQSNLGLAFDF